MDTQLRCETEFRNECPRQVGNTQFFWFKLFLYAVTLFQRVQRFNLPIATEAALRRWREPQHFVKFGYLGFLGFDWLKAFYFA